MLSKIGFLIAGIVAWYCIGNSGFRRMGMDYLYGNNSSVEENNRIRNDTNLLVLFMVKNEDEIIGRAIRSLENLSPQPKFVYVCDTGSEDDTEQEVRVNGAIFTNGHPFRDFAFNRNDCIRRAKMEFNNSIDWILFMDADHVIKKGKGNWLKDAPIDSDVVQVIMGLNPYYTNRRLFRVNSPCVYVGMTHEYLGCSNETKIHTAEMLQLTHKGDGSSRQSKFERDEALLEQAVRSNKQDARSWFYLARTYKTIYDMTGKKLYLKKALQAFSNRVSLGGWAEEVYVAKYEHAICVNLLSNNSYHPAVGYFLEAWQFRPHRYEALYYLAYIYRDHNQWELVKLSLSPILRGLKHNQGDVLFVDRTIENHKARDLYGLACFHLGEFEEAIEQWKWVITYGKDVDKKRLTENVRIAMQKTELKE